MKFIKNIFVLMMFFTVCCVVAVGLDMPKMNKIHQQNKLLKLRNEYNQPHLNLPNK